jgi:hypothetical protein
MRRSFKVALFLLAFLSTALSSSAFAQAFKPKSFVAPPGEPIKTIALLKIGEPWGYFLGEGGVSSFGFAGLFAGQFKRPKHPEYESAGFRFAVVAERVLTEHLKAAGFNVITVPVEREKPYQLLRNYKALSVPNVDAYLDVVSGGVGYRQSDSAPDFARKLGPYVLVYVRLVSARSKEILYADAIEYAWRKAHRSGLPGSEIDAPDNQVFKNADAVEMDLMSGGRSRSLAQLTQGIDVAMRRVVSEFSAYPATGLPQQAGTTPRADSPIEVAKAAPAATPSPSGAIQKGMVPVGGPKKVAIFPIGDNGSDCMDGWTRPTHKQIVLKLRQLIEHHSSLQFLHVYQSKSRREQRKLWVGSTPGQPNTELVSQLGRGRGTDVALMAWRTDEVNVGMCDKRSPPFLITLYLVDVQSGRTFSVEGGEAQLTELTEKVLAQYLNGLPKVATAATAPTQRGEVKRTQTASAASPFEGITLRPGGSVEAINAAAEAYCASLNKKSRLIAGPPNNPDYVFQCYQVTKAVSAPTPPPKTTLAEAAPGAQKGASSTPYKIAILPGSGCFINDGSAGCSTAGEEAGALALAAHINQDPTLVLVYSYYDKTRNKPSVGDTTRFWTGGAVRKKPKLSAVYALAKERNWDGIFMYWGNGAFAGGTYSAQHVPVEFYMIDVAQRQVRMYEGMTDTVEKVAEQALSRFLASAKPKVVATAPAPATAATSAAIAKAAPGVQKGAVPMAYKIAIFPFDSDTPCIGQVRPLDEKFAVQLAALIAKKDSLTLTYSYYDKSLNQPPITGPRRFWNGSKPNVAKVVSLGQTHGVDAVVMYWRPDSDPGLGAASCGSKMPPFPVDVYVVDVKQRKMYRLKGYEKNMSALADQALSRFVAGRR